MMERKPPTPQTPEPDKRGLLNEITARGQRRDAARAAFPKVHAAVEDTLGAEDIARASSQSTKMALSLAMKPGHTYEGTVPAATVARRRAAGKRARRARRAGRR